MNKLLLIIIALLVSFDIFAFAKIKSIDDKKAIEYTANNDRNIDPDILKILNEMTPNQLKKLTDSVVIGEKGDQGEHGFKGDKGDSGEKGDDG